jgi:hypothetical protein
MVETHLKEERTRFKYILYYTFCFVENTALVVAWFDARDDSADAEDTQWYRLPGIVVHYVTFFAGLLFMLLYYGFCHPTGVKVRLIIVYYS